MKVKLTEDQRKIISVIINDYLYIGYAYIRHDLKHLKYLIGKKLIQRVCGGYVLPTERLRISLFPKIDLYEMTDVRILSCIPVHQDQLDAREKYENYNVNCKNHTRKEEWRLRDLYSDSAREDCVEGYFEKLHEECTLNGSLLTFDNIPNSLEIDENII